MSKSKSVLQIFGSKVVVFVISIVRMFLVPGYLGPKMYGIINFLGLVKTILSFSSLGFDQAHLRQVLALRGSDASQERIASLQNIIFTFLMCAAILGSLITLCIPFFYRQEDPELKSIMIFAFFVTALQHFFVMAGGFFDSVCVIQKRFSFIAKLNILHVVLNFVLLISTVFVWKIYGVFLAELIATMTVQAIYICKTHIKVRFEFDWREFKKILYYAFPFALTNVSFYFARLIDKTIILVFLSFGELGLYSFALNITTYSRIVYKSVAEVLAPYFMEEMGQSERIYHLADKIKAHSLSIGLLSSVIALNAIFLCDLVKYVLPKYVESMIILKILMINSYISTVPIYQSYILGAPSIKKQNLLNGIMLLSGLINCGVSIWLIRIGWGIVGVAIGTVVSMLIWQALAFAVSHKYYLEGLQIAYYVRLLIPLGLLICATVYTQESPVFEDFRNWIVLLVSNVVLLTIFAKERRTVNKLLVSMWNKTFKESSA